MRVADIGLCVSQAGLPVTRFTTHVKRTLLLQEGIQRCKVVALFKQVGTGLDGKPVNYPALLGLAASLRTGLPVSKTRFAGTESIPVGSAVSAGIESG